MKSYEKMIELMCNIDHPYEWYYYETICDSATRGNETEFWKCLGYLKAQGLVETRESDQKQLRACRMRLTDRGVAYFQLRQEKASESRKQMLREIVIGIIGAAVGAFLGYYLK